MKNLNSISFRLKRRSKVDAITGLSYISERNLLIMMQVSMTYFDFELSTGLHVDLKDWDAENRMAKPSCSTAEVVNDGLLKAKLILKDSIRLLESKKKELSKENIRETYHVLTNRVCGIFADYTDSAKSEEMKLAEESNIFWKAFDIFLKTNSTYYGWGKACYEKFHCLRTHMKKFEDSKKKENRKFHLTFNFFSYEGLCEYAAFIQKEYDLLNSTMKKHLEFFRWFMRWAMAMDYHHNAAFELFRPKLRITDRHIIFLTTEEMKRLALLKFTKGQYGLERARDILLFMCMTGLRYSDVYELSKNAVYDDGINVTTIKTNENLRIDLNRYSRAILKKYANCKDTANNGKALPVASNQKLNKHIKKVCKMAGITETTTITQFKGAKRIEISKPKYEFISSKTGRKTFVCTALSLGISRDTIMKWTGHKDYKSMDPYVDITSKQKKESMDRFDSLGLDKM